MKLRKEEKIKYLILLAVNILLYLGGVLLVAFSFSSGANNMNKGDIWKMIFGISFIFIGVFITVWCGSIKKAK